MESLSGHLATLVTGIIIAFTSALLSVRLSIKRFRSERWWERKAESYATILESLHYMKLYCNEQFENQVGNEAIPPERLTELSNKWTTGEEAISKAIDMGLFMFSNEAIQSLSTLQDDLMKASVKDFSWENIPERIDALNGCMSNLRAIAKKDLKIG